MKTKKAGTKRQRTADDSSAEVVPKKPRASARKAQKTDDAPTTSSNAPDEREKQKTLGSPRSVKISCWNVAGYRSLLEKGSWPSNWPGDYDIVFLSELKMNELPHSDMFNDYNVTIASSSKKGYSGVALLSKVPPLKTEIGIGDDLLDSEGRLITAEYQDFWLLAAYVPNIGQGFKNKEKRQKWENLIIEKIRELDKMKPVVYCGDLNVAHNEIDLARPKQNYNRTPGFSQDERDWFTALLHAGLKDTFRELHPDEQKFSFWSYRGGSRSSNIGWRLDYVLVSERIMEKVVESDMLDGCSGSDHAPIIATLNF